MGLNKNSAECHGSGFSPRLTVLRSASCLLLSLACLVPAMANEPAACTTQEYRELDFKIGRFAGQTANGQRAGVSEVKPDLRGCVLIERWEGAISGNGMGIYFRSSSDNRWHLNYANEDGQTLELSGVTDSTGITFSGPSRFYELSGIHRIRWERASDGAVRQIWHLSKDGGATWEAVAEILLSPSTVADQSG